MRTLTVAAFAIVLVGCSTAMQTYQFDKSRSYPAPPDQVWEGVMQYFTTNNIQIKTLERDSGVVYAEKVYPDQVELQLVADCGSGFWHESALPTASLNVFIAGDFREEAETTVTVNTQFTDVYKDHLYGGMGQKPCNSKGMLEKTILNHIEAYLISR